MPDWLLHELAATVLPEHEALGVGHVETKARMTGQRGQSGGSAEAGRSSGQPEACSGRCERPPESQLGKACAALVSE